MATTVAKFKNLNNYNMGSVGKVSPIKREYSPEYQNTSIGGSLAKHGYTRLPGTFHEMIVHKEATGKYRTGLDINADYIKKMSVEEQEQEIARITKWLEYLDERVPHIDLSSSGEYYKNMMKFYRRPNGEEKAVQPYKMKDGVNIFDLSDPYQLITYAWLRVHPKVASSYMSWRLGKASPSCIYFVDDEEFQAQVEYKHKTVINKAISTMNAMSPNDRVKVARLLGLPITINTNEEKVYNLLDEFIKESMPKNGNRLSNINLFNRIVEFKQENLNIRYYIKLALDFNVYRKKGERIYDGENEVSQTEEDLVLFLTDPKNVEELSVLQDRIKQAKAIEKI